MRYSTLSIEKFLRQSGQRNPLIMVILTFPHNKFYTKEIYVFMTVHQYTFKRNPDNYI